MKAKQQLEINQKYDFYGIFGSGFQSFSNCNTNELAKIISLIVSQQISMIKEEDVPLNRLQLNRSNSDKQRQLKSIVFPSSGSSGSISGLAISTNNNHQNNNLNSLIWFRSKEQEMERWIVSCIFRFQRREQHSFVVKMIELIMVS